MNNGYSVSIAETSMELTAKQKIVLKDTSNAHKLDTTCENGVHLEIEPLGYAVLEIHNEKSDNKDYEQYVIIASDGNKYITGSSSFWNTFIDIWNEMCEETEAWSIECYKLDSKNYKGKQFLTCSII